MGKRKFRLHHRKLYSRLPRLSLKVSISRCHLDWKNLCDNVKKLHFGNWNYIFTGDYSAITLCKFNSHTPPVALMTLTILPNLDWKLHVGDKLVSGLQVHSCIESISQLFTLLNFIDKLEVCQGIGDKKFEPLINSHHGKFFNLKGKFLYTNNG